MRTIRLPLPALAALAVLAGGCAAPKAVTASYLVPPKALADVRSLDVLAIEATASLSGNQAAEGDDRRVAGIARQMLSMELYRRGFYRTTDDLWGSLDGAAFLGSALMERGSRHGYPTLVTDSGFAKATLRIDIELSYDVERSVQRQTFVLKTVPYLVHRPGEGNGKAEKAAQELSKASSMIPGAEQLRALADAAKKIEKLVPYSEPDEESTTERRVEFSWDAWQAEGRGKVHVRILPNGSEDAVYDRTFDLDVPSSAGIGAPGLPRVAAAALAPVLRDVVADISPTSEKRNLSLNRAGDARAVVLLEAGAWADAEEILGDIPAEDFTAADWENLGVLREVLGDFKAALDAYEQAIALDPENEELRKKLEGAAKSAKARRILRESGAKANKDTSFQSGSSR